MCQKRCSWNQKQNVVSGAPDELCRDTGNFEQEQVKGCAVWGPKVQCFEQGEI